MSGRPGRGRPTRTVRDAFGRLLADGAAGGLLLILAALAALAVANSAAAPDYHAALDLRLAGLSVGHWINDALMASFFLLVGLEIKREMLIGQLSTAARRALPAMAALGGMVVPASIYLLLNASGGAGASLRGWAVPTATDIAFAVGVLSLLGRAVPASLKVFLTALAIVDDLGAVLVIAVFYTAGTDPTALAGGAAVTVVLWTLNRRGVTALAPYLCLGAALWVCLLASGVHAALAGVVLAFAIPLRVADAPAPARRLEHALHPWVGLLVLPLFGFANAGVTIPDMSPARLLDPVPLGIAAALLVGKPLGVYGTAILALRLRLAPMPAGASRAQLFGVSLLCGIGFTMSLFVGLLAFADAPALLSAAKLGILLGSLASAACGVLVLRWAAAGVRTAPE